jgi:DNA primase catalytic core
MSRFAKDDIEALKATVDVAAVIGAVVELEKQGADLVGRCPFHDDATPSFHVTPHNALWHCFGCRAGGDVLAFVMKHQRVSFRHAVELLKARAPLSTTPTPSARKLPSPITLGADHAAALDDVASFYHSTLLDSREALAYLDKRGISSTAIERFGLGYANRSLGLHLPAKNRVEGEKLRGLLTDLGVYRESGHEHLAGSVVVPLLDDAGHVVGMYGRKILSNLRAGTAKHLYLPGPHRGVFNGAALSSSTEVVLCESLIDALTFWSAGIENVTTSYGVEGFTDELLSTLKRAGVRSVLIAYDADDAGNTAAASLTLKLEAEGFVVGRVHFPKGMDANEYALTVKPAARSLSLVVERARESIITARGVVVEARAPLAPTSTTTKAETQHPPP